MQQANTRPIRAGRPSQQHRRTTVSCYFVASQVLFIESIINSGRGNIARRGVLLRRVRHEDAFCRPGLGAVVRVPHDEEALAVRPADHRTGFRHIARGDIQLHSTSVLCACPAICWRQIRVSTCMPACALIPAPKSLLIEWLSDEWQEEETY